MKTRAVVALTLGCWLAAASAGAFPGNESARMARAKDAIADEHWVTAISELKAAVADAKEPNRAEAMFWLAHCQNQTGEQVAALETLARLQHEFPSSPWMRFAQSLRLEIAQKLNRDDVLWQVARPAPPPRPGLGPAIAPPPPARPVTPPAPAAATSPALPAPPAPPATYTPAPVAAAPPAPPAPPVPPDPAIWVLSPTPDTSLRIQALGSLIDTHPDRAIPLLRDIALDPSSPGDARRAVWVLAQSSRPEAQRSVLEAAKKGIEPVRIAAVKELGRFESPMISRELLQVYQLGTVRVKREVVSSLGDRSDKVSLVRIAQSESDSSVRNTAIVTLGRLGGRDELRTLYTRVPVSSRMACLTALFTARDDDELIKIAETDPNPSIRQEARRHLRLLGTPKARQYLAK